MKKNIKKKILAALCIFLSSATLIGCSGSDKNKDTKLLDEKSDKKVKIEIITPSEKDDKDTYDAAETKKLSNIYKKETNDKYEGDIEHIALPDNYSEKDVEKVFNGISRDKDVNVVVVSSNKPGMAEYAGKLKKKRKDILLISANAADRDKELIDNFDLNFTTGDPEQGEMILELAKSLGAERFIYFISDADLKNSDKMETLEGIKKKAKEVGMPLEEVKIPEEGDTYAKKAFVADAIDDLIDKYGNDINIYTFDGAYDEVLASKVLNQKFYVSEFSRPNISKELMNIYGIKSITRQKEDYVWMNTQISSLYHSIAVMDRKIGSESADAESFALNLATELGTVMKAKDVELKKAYNSYFLERLSFARTKVECGFINKYKGVGNFKIVVPNQITY